jgi:dihydroneopterin aldolase
MVSDQIYLRNYTIIAKHGYYKEEHIKAQRFIVSITADISLEKSGKSDTLIHTLNYESLRMIATDVLMESPHDLIESLALDIVTRVFDISDATRVEVVIEKPDVWFDSIP